ncbi:hypothetical protein [Methanosphaerula palustris]|nr:hypothetical protein [Methanosphaerula palustris]
MQDIEEFENKVMIRRKNRVLLGTVYADIQQDQWAVAMAYNLSHHPGLYGHEHGLEVRYSYSPQTGAGVRMFRSDVDQERTLDVAGFKSPDAFIRYAVDQEKRLANE